jgi:hypothetical protein
MPDGIEKRERREHLRLWLGPFENDYARLLPLT